MSSTRARARPDARPYDSLVAALREPHRHLIDRLHERLEAAGYGDIRPAHGNVLAAVTPDGTRSSEIAAHAQLTKQTVQYLVDDLERLGYLERVPDPSDARARLVRFTEHGRAARRAAVSAFRAIEREWALALGEEKMTRLRALLDELRVAIER
jgi:DNA-binding MarR family transcriptional regulator